MEAIEEPVNSSNKDQTRIIIKGKRTKRQRLPSPIPLPAMTAASSRTSTDNNSSGFDILTTSTAASAELRDSTEEEDMANCLILLAQGHTRKRMASPDNNDKSGTGNGKFIYECKTCNRCFHSFQALGGHRASHKKPKTSAEENKKQAVTYLNEENDHSYHDSTSTDLSLQISSRSTLSNTNTKSKVHECAICGAEFSSGQALGGHMRRHRTITASATAAGNGSAESQEVKQPRNVLKLDLNLPAPEDDQSRETKFPFHQSKEKVIVFSATSLVDCHY